MRHSHIALIPLAQLARRVENLASTSRILTSSNRTHLLQSRLPALIPFQNPASLRNLTLLRMAPSASSSSATSQPFDFDKVVGSSLPDQPVSWLQRDSLLYNLSLLSPASSTPEESIEYLYELNQNFRVLPTYVLVLGLKGASQEVTNFKKMVSGREDVKGLPNLDSRKIVHASQSLVLDRPIPTASGQGWKLVKSLSGVHDKKSGLILESEAKLVDDKGELFATMVSSAFYRGQGQGTTYSKTVAKTDPSLSSFSAEPPSKQADFSQTTQTSPLQAALYRLSGDYNPLHIDPSIGASSGLGGVILHGLCSYGIAAKVLQQSVNPTEGQLDSDKKATLKAIEGRFTSPVKPGESLRTNVWIVERQMVKGGEEFKLSFEQTVVESGKKSLGGGKAVVFLEDKPKHRAGDSKL